MTRNSLFIGAAALLMLPVIAQAQSAGAAVDQAAPALPPADAAPSSAAEAPAGAPATEVAASGVTKENGKYMKDGRKATKTEIAEYKKAGKAPHE